MDTNIINPTLNDEVTLESVPNSGAFIKYTFDGSRWTYRDANGRIQKEVLNRSNDITEFFLTGKISREVKESPWK